MYLVWAGIGFCAAFIGSILGLGGGIITVPALYYLSPYLLDKPLSIAEAVGTSIAIVVVTSFVSVLRFFKQKRIDMRSALLFFATSGPMTILGSVWTSRLDPSSFQFWFGLFLLFMASLIGMKGKLQPKAIPWKIKRTYLDASGVSHSYQYEWWPVMIIGIGVGIISGLFGIGGGALMVPMLIVWFRFPPHVATATSMLVVFFTAIVGTTTKLYLGEVHYLSAFALAPGAVIGGWAGAWLTGKISTPRLTQVLILGFSVFACYLIWKSGVF
jgi:uncharacterized membrane protein YfcA